MPGPNETDNIIIWPRQLCSESLGRKNAAKFHCSKAKLLVTFSWSFCCCKEFGQENHIQSIGSQPHPENKMIEELYGLAAEPGVGRGNVDKCHSTWQNLELYHVSNLDIPRNPASGALQNLKIALAPRQPVPSWESCLEICETLLIFFWEPFLQLQPLLPAGLPCLG